MKKLSPREQEILNLAAEGLTNAEIAQRTFVTIETVKAHLKSAYKKINVKNRVQALLYVIKNSTLK